MLAEERLLDIEIRGTQSFGDFLKSGLYTDCKLIVIDSSKNKKIYNVHRVILAKHSAYFQSAFTSKSENGTLELLLEDNQNIIPSILEYCYTGYIRFKSNRLISVIRTAVELQFPELVEHCQEYLCEWLESNTTRALQSNGKVHRVAISTYLHETLPFPIERFALQALDLIAKNTKLFAQDLPTTSDGVLDLSLLPFRYFLHFLCNPSLQLSSKFDLFKMVSHYITQNEILSKEICNSAVLEKLAPSLASKNCYKITRLSQEQEFQLFSQIPFPTFSLQELQQIVQHSSIPKNPLLQGMAKTLQTFINSKKLFASNSPNPPQPKSFTSRVFAYASDFDTHGIIYYLGTLKSPEKFQNPAITKEVICTMSSPLLGAPSNLVSRECLQTCTRCEENAWIMIDFGPKKWVQFSRYSLQYGANQNRVEFKNWNAQVSQDGKDFYTISIHKNDSSLKAPYGTHTWSLKGPLLSRKWRYFRIQTVGRWFIPICGVEFYGTLYTEKD